MSAMESPLPPPKNDGSSTRSSRTITVSAPGKILLAGGYLVLESPHVGVVFAVDQRFRVKSTVIRSSYSDNESSSSIISIVVTSAQFHNSSWSYEWDRVRKTLIASKTTDNNTATSNPFVAKTLMVTLLCFSEILEQQQPRIESMNLDILADNDFYSLVPHLQARGLARTVEGVQQLEPGLPAPTGEDGRVLKTGLGSSAGLVTSLVGSLYHQIIATTATTTPSTDTDKDDKRIIFRLAQLCHCYAQGKVGSGFDVSAACHGSHIYQRLPKELLAPILDQFENAESQNVVDISDKQTSLATAIQELIFQEEAWPGGVTKPLHVPVVLQIMLADVMGGGSESPGMARAVLAWKRNSCSESSSTIPHWDDLARTNADIAKQIQLVGDTPFSEDEIQTLSRTNAEQWRQQQQLPIFRELVRLHDLCQVSRRHLKAIGEAAGVPVEPDCQTRLLDATMHIPGVVAALVPGAGGHDALACVYVRRPNVASAIGKFWSEWKEATVCPLRAQGVHFGEGLRIGLS